MGRRKHTGAGVKMPRKKGREIAKKTPTTRERLEDAITDGQKDGHQVTERDC